MYLELNNLSIGYKEPLIEAISAHLNPGEVSLLVGSNGVGKTTLMRTILGQIPILKGDIRVEGKSITNQSAKQRAHQMAVVLSGAKVSTHLSLYDLVSLGKYIHYPYYFKLSKEDHKEVEHWIDSLGLESYKNRKLSELSDGNLQKAFIARALCQNAPILLMDEPTAHLDEKNKIMILKLLKSLSEDFNKLILFSSHDFRLAKEFSDQIWLLSEGSLDAGLAEDVLLRHPELISPVLFHLDSGFVAPKIEANTLEKELLYSFLQKNFHRDFSSMTFRYSSGKWIIEEGASLREVDSFQALGDFLGKKG